MLQTEKVDCILNKSKAWLISHVHKSVVKLISFLISIKQCMQECGDRSVFCWQTHIRKIKVQSWEVQTLAPSGLLVNNKPLSSTMAKGWSSRVIISMMKSQITLALGLSLANLLHLTNAVAIGKSPGAFFAAGFGLAASLAVQVCSWAKCLPNIVANNMRNVFFRCGKAVPHNQRHVCCETNTGEVYVRPFTAQAGHPWRKEALGLLARSQLQHCTGNTILTGVI